MRPLPILIIESYFSDKINQIHLKPDQIRRKTHMVIAVCMNKGGVGKTTTAVIMAQAAAQQGAHVLTIDADPQQNLTATMAAPDDDKTGNVFKLLTRGDALQQVHRSRHERIDIIPASDMLSTITSAPGSARRLQEALKPIAALYDVVIIDTPTAGGELQYNALQAADRLIVPVVTDKYSVDGLNQVMETAQQIQETNPRLKMGGLIITQYNGRESVDRQFFRLLINRAVGVYGLPFLGTVRPSAKVREAAGLSENIYMYAKRSTIAADYMDIFNEVTNYQYT